MSAPEGDEATVICTGCGANIETADVFCRACGTKQELDAAPAPDSHGVRRRLSAMFYDVVGSTELSTEVDPEDLQLALSRFQAMCIDVLRSYGGFPANTMGDGGLAYFGYPIANEDDPVRAVTAGLAILSELPSLNESVREEIPGFGHEIRMRIGIHTGTVVVGEVGSDLRSGRLAMGEALNEAARIESKAPTNAVAVSDVTARRISGVVDLTSIGVHDLKGLPEPVEIFTVDRVRAGQGRAAVSSDVLSSLVGRDDLLSSLRTAFVESADGNGRSLILRGEAGIGKSRLHRALRQELTRIDHDWIEIKGSAVMAQSAFFPVIEALRELVGAGPTTPDDQVASLLQASLADADTADDDVAGLLVGFVTHAVADDLEISPEDRRERVIDAIVDWLAHLAQQRPIVVVAEDLHWFDPSSLALLSRLIARLDTASILVIGTVRQEFDFPWGDSTSVFEVEPLGLDAISSIVEQLVKDSDLSDVERAALVTRSDGVPLFAEELALAAVDPSNAAGQLGEVPSTLIELLQARLDRLGPERHSLQVAAILGEEFAADLAEAAIGVPDLSKTLSEFVDGRFLIRRGIGDGVIYSFRHALMHDAAYDTMLRRERESEHLRIAEILEADFVGRPAGRPEVIGHHLECAGERYRALGQFRRAADDAHARYALVESAAHYQRCLGLLDDLPPDADRPAAEVDIQLELGSVLGVTDSFAAPTTRAAYERAVELCRDAGGGLPRHFEALQGLNRVLHTGIDFDSALVVAEELNAFAEQHDHRQARLSAELAFGQVHFWQGRFGAAAAALGRARDLYDPADPPSRRYAIGVEMGVTALAFSAYATWALGSTEESLAFADESIVLAEQQDDLYQTAYANTYASIHAVMTQDPERCERLARKGRDLARQHGFIAIDGLSGYTLGWARAVQGDETGLDTARTGVGILAGVGAGLGAPGCMAVMAELCAEAEALEEGQAYIELGEAMAAASSQDFYLAEIHRSAALLHLCAADAHRAESDGDGEAESLAAAQQAAGRALDVARSQESPTLEARALEVVELVTRHPAAGRADAGIR